MIYLKYGRRSSVTGRALFDMLKERHGGGIGSISDTLQGIRRSNQTPPRREVTGLIRWGSSTPIEGDYFELNTQEAVARTTDKLEMIRTLLNAEGVNTPPCSLSSNIVVTGSTNVYIRDRQDNVRYTSILNWANGDKYYTMDVPKNREFRVHIFNGRTIGIYEKIPNNPTDPMWKNDNTTFRRIDQSDGRVMRHLRGLRPMSRAAVSALGLVFGGVDVIKSTDGQYYVTEVNSSPALNDPNLERWADEIAEYVRGALNGTTPAQPQTTAAQLTQQQEVDQEAAAVREEQERARITLLEEKQRMSQLNDVIRRINVVARDSDYRELDEGALREMLVKR